MSLLSAGFADEFDPSTTFETKLSDEQFGTLMAFALAGGTLSFRGTTWLGPDNGEDEVREQLVRGTDYHINQVRKKNKIRKGYKPVIFTTKMSDEQFAACMAVVYRGGKIPFKASTWLGPDPTPNAQLFHGSGNINRRRQLRKANKIRSPFDFQ